LDPLSYNPIGKSPVIEISDILPLSSGPKIYYPGVSPPTTEDDLLIITLFKSSWKFG